VAVDDAGKCPASDTRLRNMENILAVRASGDDHSIQLYRLGCHMMLRLRTIWRQYFQHKPNICILLNFDNPFVAHVIIILIMAIQKFYSPFTDLIADEFYRRGKKRRVT
jgi:hypothetical protein